MLGRRKARFRLRPAPAHKLWACKKACAGSSLTCPASLQLRVVPRLQANEELEAACNTNNSDRAEDTYGCMQTSTRSRRVSRVGMLAQACSGASPNGAEGRSGRGSAARPVTVGPKSRVAGEVIASRVGRRGGLSQSTRLRSRKPQGLSRGRCGWRAGVRQAASRAEERWSAGAQGRRAAQWQGSSAAASGRPGSQSAGAQALSAAEQARRRQSV